MSVEKVIEAFGLPPERTEAIQQEPKATDDFRDGKFIFQLGVAEWMLSCFGALISMDKAERNHRFLEEALELVQSLGCSQEDAHTLVDYVYGRPIGDPPQEVGGVMVTLAALCQANGMDMQIEGNTELARVWGKMDQIRAKQAAKPKFGPLPMAVDSEGGCHD